MLREGSGVRAAREAVLERSAGELAEAVERPKRAYPSVDPLDGGVARLDPARPADAEQASRLAGERARRGAEQIRRSHREDDELRVQAPEVTDERLLVAQAGPEDAKIHHAGVTRRREPSELRLHERLPCREEDAGVAEQSDRRPHDGIGRVELARRLVGLREHHPSHVVRVLEGGRAPEQQRVRDANVDQRQEDERDAPRDGMVRGPPLH